MLHSTNWPPHTYLCSLVPAYSNLFHMQHACIPYLHTHPLLSCACLRHLTLLYIAPAHSTHTFTCLPGTSLSFCFMICEVLGLLQPPRLPGLPLLSSAVTWYHSLRTTSLSDGNSSPDCCCNPGTICTALKCPDGFPIQVLITKGGTSHFSFAEKQDINNIKLLKLLQIINY